MIIIRAVAVNATVYLRDPGGETVKRHAIRVLPCEEGYPLELASLYITQMLCLCPLDDVVEHELGKRRKYVDE